MDFFMESDFVTAKLLPFRSKSKGFSFDFRKNKTGLEFKTCLCV